jgi:hypothetical protein
MSATKVNIVSVVKNSWNSFEGRDGRPIAAGSNYRVWAVIEGDQSDPISFTVKTVEDAREFRNFIGAGLVEVDIAPTVYRGELGYTLVKHDGDA